MFLAIVFLLLAVNSTFGQTSCTNGVLVYEKSSATSVRSETKADRTIEMLATESPTATCQRVCDGTPSCTAYSVDYTSRTCKTYSVPIVQSRFTSKSDTAFFQKTCLPNTPRDFIRLKCGNRLWAIERVRGVGFEGTSMKTEQSVTSREFCLRACVTETSFECASAVYDEVSKSCSLNVDDRRTRPSSIIENLRTSDYIENQCVSDSRQCQFQRQNNVRVVSVDYTSTVSGEEQCQHECIMNKAIVCRSYSYDLQRNVCELSSDDSISVQGVDLLQENGRRYAERRCQHSASFLSPQVQPNPFQMPFGPPTSPNQFPNVGNTVYPQIPPGGGNSRFDQFENQDPRVIFSPFNQRPGVYPTTGFNPYAPQSNLNRCFLEKSTGLSVLAEPRGVIPTTGFFSRGVTSLCASWCQMQGPYTCPAFTVDYNNNRCTVLSRPAEVALRPGMTHGQSYLEQVCFNDNYRSCEGKSWAFERVINIQLQGLDDRVLTSVSTRRDCEEACLRESRFLCLSAEFDSSRGECRLSRESRTTRPSSVQQAANTDYLENQCVPPNTLSSCIPQRQIGYTLLYADASLSQIFSEDECRRACLTFPNFTCNAASYRQLAQECLLSSEATVVTLPDAVILYTSCVQINQVAPQSPPNNYGFTGQIQPTTYNPGTNSLYPVNNYPNAGFNPNFGNNNNNNPFLTSSGLIPQNSNTFSTTNSNFIPGSIGSGIPGFPQSPSFYPQQGYGQSFPQSGQQFPGTGQIFPGAGQIFPGAGQTFPGTGQTFPGAGQIFPGTGQQFLPTGQSGQQFPSTGQVFPGSGQQFPSTGQQFPSTVQQYPYSGQQNPGQQFPVTGQQFPISGQQFPPTQISGGFPPSNNFGQVTQRPYATNFDPQFQSPAFQRPFTMIRPTPNREFLLAQQSPPIPLLIPGRSTPTGSSKTNSQNKHRHQFDSGDVDDSVEESSDESGSRLTGRRNPSRAFPYTTDSQPK